MCRSVPCGSVRGLEAVMVCRFFLQTRRLPCKLLLRSRSKCNTLEFPQNAIPPSSDSCSWTTGEASILLRSQTLSCKATLSNYFTSPWNETQLSFPIHVSTDIDASLTRYREVAPRVKHSESHNSPYFQLNFVSEVKRTSLADSFGLNRELLENTLPGWLHQPVGK